MFPLLSLLPVQLQGSVMGQNGVEFRQESNGHSPIHMTHVAMCPLLILLPGEPRWSERGQNGVEFYQDYNGHGPRHVTHVQK